MVVYDHIIIGSGINGLVAAAMLSKSGARVLLLEREQRLGGCMFSAEATLPGFTHDVMAATFVLFLTGPAHGALGQDLARHGLEFCHTPHPTAALRPDGSSVVLTTDRAANVRAFNGLSSGDGDRHAADVGSIETSAELLFGLLGGQLWSLATAKLLAREAWRRGLRGLVDYFGGALAPARGWLETNYKSPNIQALHAPWALHCGLSPEDTYSAQMGKVIAFALEAAGAPIVKGGAGKAVDAFRALIQEQGGTIRTGADVERILVRGGKATGVQLAGGEEIGASNSVIASVAPGQLYGRLLGPDAPSLAKDATRAYRHGRGNFQLHYALDRAPRWRGEGLEKVALIHLTDGIDAVSKSHNEATRGMLPVTPTMCVGQPASLDPSRCPEGKAILWIQVPDAPRAIKGDAAGEIATRGVWDEATREAFADRLEAILANHIEGFRETVLARRAYSPADLEAMNINLVGGDPYGGACTIDQFFVWRPFAGSVNHRSAIKSLYHIGASTHPGPGLGGGSGFLVTKEFR
ncbi:NAD(P)/FAD-dependent oxidoreductase [Mesorhizobium sp. IRAMC:0171]|uniref:NAD(P)/FAD-dependent oxidoreductase n=1 Tax=Mesorhizobium retamae TaxID=2912854 RepID=A0ABS9QFJ4_9HYPH|nr:NAD(P)/FAD-dependent oxidoreductase [Mesorhizobium sp. IRAMC:0171]